MLNKEKLRKIKLFLVDVDGVMTDGGIYYFDNGSRARRYHMHDGRFKALESQLGIKSGFCTGEDDLNIRLRAEKLNLMEYSLFGSKDKVKDVGELLRGNGWEFENLAYVGDDLGDLELLKRAGLSFAVNNAVPEIISLKEIDYTTKKQGGEGAVREIIDLILSGSKKKLKSHLNVGMIIQARMGSTRLPKKSLTEVNGKPLISYLIESLRKCSEPDKIILATTISSQDDVLEEYAKANDVSFFRGSEQNVLDRFIRCAEENKLDVIVRICGDSPFIEPEQIDRLVKIFSEEKDLDYLSLNVGNKKPIILTGFGLAVEVFSLEALKKISLLTIDKINLEHVTPFIYNNQNLFKIKYLNYPKISDISQEEIRLTIDTLEDLNIFKEIIVGLQDKNISLDNVLEYLKMHPDLKNRMKIINEDNKK